jgi:hypothetical protein
MQPETGSAALDAWKGTESIVGHLASHASYATHILGNRIEASSFSNKIASSVQFWDMTG